MPTSNVRCCAKPPVTVDAPYFPAMRPNSFQINETNSCHQQNGHVSAPCYYGYLDIKPSTSGISLNEGCQMETEESGSGLHNNYTRKRTAGFYDCPANKRLREEEMVPLPTQPSVKLAPSFLQPTHKNPDISRCLMSHMI